MSSLDPSATDSSSFQGFYSWTDTLKGVYYGPGSVVYALPKLLDTLGVKKALIVTGRSLREKVSSGIAQPVMKKHMAGLKLVHRQM